MREAVPDECDETGGIRHSETAWPRFQHDDCGIDFRRGPERTGFDGEEIADAREDGGLHGEESVITRARSGGEALRHLVLHEEDSARGTEGRGLFQDGRGDVVGQVAGERNAAPLAQIGREDVGMEHLKARFGGESALQVADEVAIEFNGDDATGTVQKMFCEGSASGSDFDDELFRFRADGGCDTLQDRLADEKMLAEFLAGQGWSALYLDGFAVAPECFAPGGLAEGSGGGPDREEDEVAQFF